MSATALTAIYGAITSTLGLIIHFINYKRDQANLKVTLQWDMKLIETPEDGNWGVIRVSNIGRRPLYITHVYLELPNKGEFGLLEKSLVGQKISEADPPLTYQINQEYLKQYSKNWKKIRCCVVDSIGNTYYSKPVKIIPSWVNENL